MKKFKFFVAIIGLLSLFVLPSLVFAAPPASSTTFTPIGTSDLGIGYGTAVGLTTQDIRITIASIIRDALGLLGIVAVVIILYGGMLWMIARGDDKQVEKAKNLMIQGVIGLAIILAAFAIATFVINSLIGATGGATQTSF